MSEQGDLQGLALWCRTFSWAALAGCSTRIETANTGRKRGLREVLIHGQTVPGPRGVPWPHSQPARHEEKREAALGQAFGDFLSTCTDWNNRKSLQWGPWGRAGAKSRRTRSTPPAFPSQPFLGTGTPTKVRAAHEASTKHLLYAWPCTKTGIKTWTRYRTYLPYKVSFIHSCSQLNMHY